MMRTEDAAVACPRWRWMPGMLATWDAERVSVIPLAGGLQWHALRERNPGTGLVIGSGPNEATALVMALRAAP